MITIETRLRDAALFPVLERMAALYSRLERLLFVALYARGEKLNDAKRRFVTEHRITARQFNAIGKQLEAKVESWREVRKLNLSTVEGQIERVTAGIAKAKSPFAKHQKKRRLRRLLDRKPRIVRDITAPVPSICFGSRTRFKEQFELKANGHASHAHWRKAWREARSSSFFILGSSDESAGNQTCQYRAGTLQLRLPDALEGQTLTIPVQFPYRESDFLAALMPTQQVITRGPRKGDKVERGSAISYRFIRRDDRWYVQAMFDVESAPVTTDRRNGCLGVDLNPWGLAVTRIDSSGNPVDHFDVPWSLADRSEDQNQAQIGDAVRAVVLYAREKGVPIAAERLDFTEKKKQDRGARCNEMLSAFAYAAFAQTIRGRCARETVELIEVNPAFTSVIGSGKFAAGYGLSVHRAAACVIARRALHFGEKFRTRSTRTALTLPVRNRARHVWYNWGQWMKAQRPRRSRSSEPKGSHGPKPSRDREITPDPSPPNNRRINGCAGEVTTRINASIIVPGATPGTNGRTRCSRGLVALSQPALGSLQ